MLFLSEYIVKNIILLFRFQITAVDMNLNRPLVSQDNLQIIFSVIFCSAKMPGQSQIWKIGCYARESSTTARCLQCNRTLITSKGSTTTLRTHLIFHTEYSEKLKQFEAAEKEPRVKQKKLDEFKTKVRNWHRSVNLL